MNRDQIDTPPGTSILLRPPASIENSTHSFPGPRGPRRPGGNDTGGPDGPNDHGAHPPVPGPVVPPPPSDTSGSDNSGGSSFGQGIHIPGAWPIYASRAIPVDVRRNQRRDPRRTRSAHRP